MVYLREYLLLCKSCNICAEDSHTATDSPVLTIRPPPHNHPLPQHTLPLLLSRLKIVGDLLDFASCLVAVHHVFDINYTVTDTI